MTVGSEVRAWYALSLPRTIESAKADSKADGEDEHPFRNKRCTSKLHNGYPFPNLPEAMLRLCGLPVICLSWRFRIELLLGVRRWKGKGAPMYNAQASSSSLALLAVPLGLAWPGFENDS